MFYKVIANTTCYLLWQISLAESGCIVWEAHPLLTRLILQLPHMFTTVGFPGQISEIFLKDFFSKNRYEGKFLHSLWSSTSLKKDQSPKIMKNRKPRLCKKSSVEAQHPQLSLSGWDNLWAHCTPLSYPHKSSGLYWAGWPMVGFATFCCKRGPVETREWRPSAQKRATLAMWVGPTVPCCVTSVCIHTNVWSPTDFSL